GSLTVSPPARSPRRLFSTMRRPASAAVNPMAIPITTARILKIIIRPRGGRCLTLRTAESVCALMVLPKVGTYFYKSPAFSAGANPGVTMPLGAASIKSELGTPIDFLFELWLVLLIQHTSLQHEKVHLSPHKATITVFRRADDRLATHVETGVDDDRTTGLAAKGFDDFPVQRICFFPDGLDPGGVINVRDRGDLGPTHVQLIDAPKLFFRAGHLAPAAGRNVSHQHHVGAVVVQCEPFGGVVAQHAGSKRTKAFDLFD